MEENKTADTLHTEQEIIEEGKIYAFLGYWHILFLIPLLLKKENRFALFHGKQGLVLFVLEMIVWTLGFIPFIGWFVIRPIGYIFCGVMAIIGMAQSLRGEYWRMPWLGKYAEGIKI